MAERRGKPRKTGRARVAYASEQTVLDAALTRIRWLFDEFEGRIVVNCSGGKDSTVVLELALQVAREKDMLPLQVQWVDQECEFQATVDYQRYIATRPELKFDWWQVPFRLFNATNHSNPWLNVWGPGEEWVRPKESYSIHDHDFHYPDGKKVDRFKDVLSYINSARSLEGNGEYAILTGMRAEESPNRRITLIANPRYKWVTWSSHEDTPGGAGSHYRFHPIWDWGYKDVWKAIYDHDWRYCAMYDMQYRYGVPVAKMRVSNYHHVQALGALDYLQEAEPQTWEAATRRLEGINAHGHVGSSIPSQLPYMFKDWSEYAQHLVDHLAFPEHQPAFTDQWSKMRHMLPHLEPDVIARKVAAAVAKNDYVGASLDSFITLNRKFQKDGKTITQAVLEAALEDEDDAMIGATA